MDAEFRANIWVCALAAADGIVGGGIVLVRDGRLVAHHEFGYADREHGVPTSLQSIYHYGSITKTLTAVSIIQLRDRKKLTLDSGGHEVTVDNGTDFDRGITMPNGGWNAPLTDLACLFSASVAAARPSSDTRETKPGFGPSCF